MEPNLNNQSTPVGKDATQSASSPPLQPGGSVAPSPVAMGPVSEPSHNPKVAPKGRTTKIIVAILLAIVVFTGGYFVWAHFIRAKNNPTATNTAVVKKDIPLIRYALVDGPISDIYPSAAPSDGSLFIDGQVFEGLVAYQDASKIVPLLATSWTNPDDSTWIFTLKSGVKFHTGRTMTATDVKFSIDHYKGVSFNGEFGTTIKSVTVMAPDKVKITTNGPDPILLHRLVYLYVVDSHSTKKEDAINGTGPYTIKAPADKSGKSLDLAAVDNYHGGHVYTKEIKVSLINKETDALPLLKNRQIDLFFSFVNTSDVDTAKTDGANVTPDKSASVAVLGFNTKIAPLNNLKIRQALSVGLDKAAIFKANLIEGTPLDQFVTQSIPGYDPTLVPKPADITKAKQLVIDSGIKNPTFTVLYSSDLQKAVAEIKRQAALIGITINLSPQTNFDNVVNVVFNGSGQAYYLGYVPDLNDASDTFSSLFQGASYDSKSVDALMTEANKELDGSKRVATLQHIAQTLNADVPAVAIGNRTEFYAASNANYYLHRDLPTSNIGVYFWKTYQQ